MWLGLPLVYFHGLAPSRYLAIWPVFVLRDLVDVRVFGEDLSVFGECRLGVDGGLLGSCQLLRELGWCQ